MPEEEIKYIKKIQLSDGSVHWIKDSNALPLSGGQLTGDLKVDTLIKTNKLLSNYRWIDCRENWILFIQTVL